MLETKKRPKNFFFLPSFFFPIYIYMHMLLYVRIPKGERTRNRPWSKGRFALATRIECTGLPSFSSRTTMRHKGGRTRQPHNARASVPFSRRVFVVPSVPLGLFTIFFSLRHQRPADTHFAGREVKLAPLPGCREGFFCVQPHPPLPSRRFHRLVERESGENFHELLADFFLFIIIVIIAAKFRASVGF